MEPWTEFISSLADDRFFYIMRLYLGEIKTPYNKARLIEQLASFLRNKKNLESITALLSETDVKFLTAINVMKGIPISLLNSFFQGEYSTSFIHSKFINLQERLLIYTEKNTWTDESIIKINPLVHDELEPYLNLKYILPEPEIEKSFLETSFSLSPNFLAAFLSYINMNGCALKADGNFKKADVANLTEIFGEKIPCLHYLVTALINLSVIHEGEKKLTVDEKKLAEFAKLPEITQYIFLAVSSVMRISREGLKRQGQLFADVLASIPEGGCTKKVFLRMAQIFSSGFMSAPVRKTVSRFSQMLDQVRTHSESSMEIRDEISLMDAVFDAAVEFGLLSLHAETESGENVYVPGICTDNVITNSGFSKKVLNINAASSVTLLPGLSLKELIQFIYFMQAVKCSTVTEYEISRKSVSVAFDKGMNLEELTGVLSDYATFELPQNLIFNLTEWYNSYNSVALYKGYILKVSKENVAMIENNSSLSVHIKEKLAEGIYLLDIPFDEDPSAFVKASGFDFMGSVKTVKIERDGVSFPNISLGTSFNLLKNNSDDFKPISEIECEKIENQFLDILENSKLSEQQKENMTSRILNHLVISESQIISSAVRSEILVADGIDFHAKIHLVDASIKSNDNLLITIPGKEIGNEPEEVKVHPLKLIKSEGETLIRYEDLQNQELKTYPISRIIHIKRIKT